MNHLVWQYLHILLFVFWLGGDVGVWLSMAFVRDARLSFETRARWTFTAALTIFSVT